MQLSAKARINLLFDILKLSLDLCFNAPACAHAWSWLRS
jgi:hypothetical protein